MFCAPSGRFQLHEPVQLFAKRRAHRRLHLGCIQQRTQLLHSVYTLSVLAALRGQLLLLPFGIALTRRAGTQAVFEH